ncbi:UNVERIFIED_CONTAM: hypothetical protein PYX00_004950 [Menopon gallinae]|uniref:Uncharacterized protein n=1 Tax=Menopon gallinae TaxID=328185 RepID=A0AAW2I787_9NEOP
MKHKILALKPKFNVPLKEKLFVYGGTLQAKRRRNKANSSSGEQLKHSDYFITLQFSLILISCFGTLTSPTLISPFKNYFKKRCLDSYS